MQRTKVWTSKPLPLFAPPGLLYTHAHAHAKHDALPPRIIPIGSKQVKEVVREDPGLTDIAHVVQWVTLNIEAFGGDTGNVTVIEANLKD